MELITNILIEYLKHNKRIVVPKLGAFIVKQPSGIIRFTDLIRNDDGVLRSLLIAYGISELEAIGKIDRYVFEIRHALSQGEKYTIANLGEFRSGENNTILFSHKSEPRVIGGSIKPPVEALNLEKLKLGLLTNTISLSESEVKAQKAKPKPQAAETNTLSSNKPDYYLRGLNYDDRKKKRGEDRTDKRRAPRRGIPLLLLLIFIMIAGGLYGLWYWLSSKQVAPHETTYVIEEHPIMEADSLMMQDSLMVISPIDSLEQTPTMVLNNEIYETNYSVTE
ncbi:MAG: hypothetical protein J6U73_01685 [Alistipes sp.]|nr:hypothetical protein [Alistipes sp.]